MSYPIDKEYVIVESFILLAHKKYGDNRLVVFYTVTEWLKEIGWCRRDIDYYLHKFDNSYDETVIEKVPTRFSVCLNFGFTANCYELTLEEIASLDLHKDLLKLGIIPEDSVPQKHYNVSYSELYDDNEVFNALVKVLHKHFPESRVKAKNFYKKDSIVFEKKVKY